jgi:hypothetical protein
VKSGTGERGSGRMGDSRRGKYLEKEGIKRESEWWK